MSHYIGNARSLEIYAPNRRDDLIPEPNINKVTFELSQEVPGGYESNVVVVRRKFLYNELCKDNTTVSFDEPTNSLSTTDAILAAVLSSVIPGQSVKVSGSANNNGLHRVLSINYTPGGTGSNISVFFDFSLPIDTTELSGPTITLIQAFDGPWEVLEPEIDYIIEGVVGPQYNRLITLSEVLQEEDVCYVLHRGDSTYNFTPSQASVGPDQLQENLRNFKFDRFVGDNIEDTFVLSQFAVNSKSIIVYVNGVVQEPSDAFYLSGDYTLDPDGVTLTFTNPPPNLAKIRVLHLGFSTVSRRAALSDGQIGAIGVDTVDTIQLKSGAVTEPKLATNSISSIKIQDNAITGSKILLNYNEYLESKNSSNAEVGILKLSNNDSGNHTLLISPNDLLFGQGSALSLRLESLAFRPILDNSISLGLPSYAWSALYVKGISELVGTNINGALSVTGNISVTGTVDSVDVSDLNTQVQNLVPAGTILMTGRATAPTGYLLCDGAIYAQAAYSALFAAIGSAYNIGGEGVGNFRVPDLKQRFALGKASAGTGSILGTSGGTIDHIHTISNHTHDILHTHTVPGHYHAHNISLGSNINIIASGNHQIDLAHGHANSITPISEGGHIHNQNFSNNAFTTSDGTHSHGHAFLILSSGAHDHTFSGTTLSENAAHTHRSWPSSIIGAGTGNADRISVEFQRNNLQGSRTPEPSWEYNMVVRGEDETAHTHDEGTGTDKTYALASAPEGAGGFQQSNTFRFYSQLLPWYTDSQSANHQHQFGGTTSFHAGHGHTLSGTINNAGQHAHYLRGTIDSASSSHQHTIIVNALPSGTFSSSTGVHTHNTNAFSGSIGNVNDNINGNSAITTVSQSTATSGTGGAGSSGASNPPFCVVNYIIKT